MGLPLVLLPGSLCDERVWRSVISSLPEGQEVLTPALGHAQCWDQEIEALLSRLPLRFDLAGFSLGGIAALALARKAPERLGKLLLVASTSRDDPPAAQERRSALLQQAYENGSPALLAMGQVAEPDLSQLSLSSRALLQQMAREMPLERFACQTMLACTRSDSRSWLGFATMRVRVIYGDADPFCPVDRQQEILDLVPFAEKRVIAGGGHWLPLTHPELLAACLVA
uniref:alpha/beta fold hydrolase n=1 Tax=Marinobacterium profundum TaxID=1714300 RepID=UPI00083375EB|nr:alpha/beta hydrolase [Marinobacterium profundum]